MKRQRQTSLSGSPCEILVFQLGVHTLSGPFLGFKCFSQVHMCSLARCSVCYLFTLFKEAKGSPKTNRNWTSVQNVRNLRPSHAPNIPISACPSRPLPNLDLRDLDTLLLVCVCSVKILLWRQIQHMRSQIIRHPTSRHIHAQVHLHCLARFRCF